MPIYNNKEVEKRFKRYVKNYLGLPVLVMRKEDVFAHKLAALLTRRFLANRDIFDIWFMANSDWNVNTKLLEERTKLGFKDYIQKCIDLLEKDPPVSILSGLGELIDNKTKDWAKLNLVKDTIFYLRLLQNSR